MAADTIQCPNCGAERPANAPEIPCSSCLTGPAPTADQLASTQTGATIAPTAWHRGPSPETMQAETGLFATRPGEIAGHSKKRPLDSDQNTDGIGVDQFVQALDDLGLMDRADAQLFLAKSLEFDPRCDSRQLASELVDAGRLTAYQAGAICQGKSKGLVIGRYTVLDKLGAGGMGMVFKAQHRRLKTVVALKILPPSLTRNPELVQRFHREAETVAKLNHPNIVRAIDADDAGGTHFLVMEFVEGTTLSKLVRTRGVLTQAKALGATIQAARGLAIAHEAGIVHRDIKPSNLMIDHAGVVKILDLGLARLTGDDSADSEAITLSGSLMGTVDFMSPEQAFDPRLADARSDIYSLGCTLYFLLTATEPYRAASLMQRLLAHREGSIPSVRYRRPDVSTAVDELFRSMVAKAPQDRPGSMAELVNRLEACAATAKTAAPRNPRALMVFNDQVKFVPEPAAAPAPSAPPSEVHVDSNPLPRMTAADLDSPRSGSGVRVEDKKLNAYMIYETDIFGLHSWVEFVRSRDAMPANVSVYNCEDRPTFAAIALSNRRQVAWDFTTHSELYQFNIYSNTMQLRGFRLARFDAYQVASRSGIVSHFRKSDDIIHQSLGLDLPGVRTTLEEIEKSAYRLIYLAAYPTKEGRRFAVISSSPSLYPQRHAYELTFDALKVFATRAKADGYLPISLTASAVGERSAFSIILEQVPDRGCELSFGLTQDALANEFDRRARRGFSPIVFCGFGHVDSVLFNVGWIQGRLPKGL